MKGTDLPVLTLQKEPDIHQSVFIAPGARIIGNVTLKESSSVWYNAVLRGDINRIEVGIGSNIQDGGILHLENELPCIVGNHVTVGHGAILHGCIIGDACLIGMGAIVMSGAVIGYGSIVAAGAVVKEDQVVPPFSLVAGVPAQIRKTLSTDIYEHHIQWATKYIQLAKLYKTKNLTA